MTYTFYATVSADYIRPDMPAVPMLITATSFWNRNKRWYAEIPQANIPARLSHIAVDCGGYVASKKLGAYPFTTAQYVHWLSNIRPVWAATMDFCCEDEITAGKPGLVRQRQRWTTDMAWLFWQQYRNVSWRWLPTIQGWTVADYVWHARQMKPLLIEMKAFYGDDFVVGIGTLCKRASGQMIRDVIKAVSWELPGFKFHLWGIKLNTLVGGLPSCVASSDSAAWHTTGSFASHKAARQASGLTKRDYELKHSLPAYLKRIDNAQNMNLPLFAEDLA